MQIQLRLLEYTPFDNFKKIIPLLENDSLRQKPMKKKIKLVQSIFDASELNHFSKLDAIFERL